jgi:hypothetical protein
MSLDEGSHIRTRQQARSLFIGPTIQQTQVGPTGVMETLVNRTRKSFALPVSISTLADWTRYVYADLEEMQCAQKLAIPDLAPI